MPKNVTNLCIMRTQVLHVGVFMHSQHIQGGEIGWEVTKVCAGHWISRRDLLTVGPIVTA